MSQEDKVLYYGSAYLRKVGMQEIDEASKKLLNKLGINYMTLDPEPFGLEWIPGLGYPEKSLALMKKFNELLKKINPCCVASPLDGVIYMWNAGLESMGLEPAVRFTDFSNFLYDWFMERGKPEFNEYSKKAYLHYPCCIGRKLGKGIYAEKILALLKMIPGLVIVETVHPDVQIGLRPPWAWSPCALSSMQILFPELHSRALVEELRFDFEAHKPEVLVTPCARAVWSFRNAFEKENVKDVEVIHISELLLKTVRWVS